MSSFFNIDKRHIFLFGFGLNFSVVVNVELQLKKIHIQGLKFVL